MNSSLVIVACAGALTGCEWWDRFSGSVSPGSGSEGDGGADAGERTDGGSWSSGVDECIHEVDAAASAIASHGLDASRSHVGTVGSSSAATSEHEPSTSVSRTHGVTHSECCTSADGLDSTTTSSGMKTSDTGQQTGPHTVACAGTSSSLGPVAFASGLDASGGAFRGPSAVAAGDFDGDGLPDILAMGESSTKVEWFEAGPGSGQWVRHVLPVASTERPFLGSAKIADVDADGDNDIVASMDNHSNADKSAYVYWWENPGGNPPPDAAWLVHPIYGPLDVHHINDMELADLDSDGKLDVVVRSLDGNALHLFFQDTSGWIWRTIDARPFGKQGEGVSVGQLDGARGPDIAICGHWLESPEDPRQDEFVSHTVDAEYSAVNANVKQAIGDIDGDGRVDILISPAEGGRGGGNHVLAWYQGPASVLSVEGWKRTVIRSNLNGAHTAQLGDVDNDGDLDVLSGVAWDKWEQTRSITLYYNDGAGNFPMSQVVSNTEGLYTGVFVDLGNDGDLDIVGQGQYAGSSRPDVYESLLCDNQN